MLRRSAKLSRVIPGALLTAVAGCHGTPSAAPGQAAVPASLAVRSASSSVVSLQRSVDYRRAWLAFDDHDYRAALAQLDRMLADPSYKDAERTFLQRQRAICAERLGVEPRRREEAKNGESSPHPPAPSPKNGRRGASPRRPALADCGPRALAVVCGALGVKAEATELARLAETTEHGTTMAGLAKAAKAVGLKAQGVQMDLGALKQLDSPAIAWVEGDHYVAVLGVPGDEATIRDPNADREETIGTRDLLTRSGGVLLLVRR